MIDPAISLGELIAIIIACAAIVFVVGALTIYLIRRLHRAIKKTAKAITNTIVQ